MDTQSWYKRLLHPKKSHLRYPLALVTRLGLTRTQSSKSGEKHKFPLTRSLTCDGRIQKVCFGKLTRVVCIEPSPVWGRPSFWDTFIADIECSMNIRACVGRIKKYASVDLTESSAWLVSVVVDSHRLIEKFVLSACSCLKCLMVRQALVLVAMILGRLS